jgi:hypothetical protein
MCQGQAPLLRLGARLSALKSVSSGLHLRVDVAWSPDARPIGAYLLAGHLF